MLKMNGTVTLVNRYDLFYTGQKTSTTCPKSSVSRITDALFLWREASYCKVESDSGRPNSSLDPGESPFAISDPKNPIRRVQNWSLLSGMQDQFKWDGLINSSKVCSFLFPKIHCDTFTYDKNTGRALTRPFSSYLLLSHKHFIHNAVTCNQFISGRY